MAIELWSERDSNFKPQNPLNMKTIKLKFKTLLVLLLLGFAFTSCGNDEKDDKKNPDADANNPKQVNKTQTANGDADATSSEPNSNSPQLNNSRIAEEEGGATSPDSPEGNTAPIALDCNYFSKNPHTVLKDNPEASVDYIIPCMARIDGKLTIEPGVVIAFEQGAGMDFQAKSAFKMEGTAEKPIILTGKEETKGYWRGIYTESPSVNNKMSYVTVDYAGGSKAALEIYKESSNLSLDHCTFSNSKNLGMLVNSDVEKDVHNIVIKNCTFTKNKIPFQTDASRLRMFDGTSSFTGNDKDYIHLGGETLHGDATWAKLDVPYFLQDNFKYEDGVLSVEPGTEIIMSSQVWVHLSDKASLVMVGTAEDPIIIRGEHDVPGFWDGLMIDSSSPLNEIAHVNFKNAGKTTGKPNGAVKLPRSKFLNIHDVVFSDCFEYGLSVHDLARSHLEHENLTLENTPKLFSDWDGKEIADPENP
jgi:predicted small lipoprotein YifL